VSKSPESGRQAAPEPVVSNSKALPKVQIRGVNFFYGSHQVLRGVSMDVPALQVTALIGPSGCGKTTLLRCLNRMHDLYPGNRYEGSIQVQPDGTDILRSDMDPIQVRMRFGMVFQKPNPFPKSIYENVAYGLRLQGMNRRRELDERVEKALRERVRRAFKSAYMNADSGADSNGDACQYGYCCAPPPRPCRCPCL
jgi:ABC-type phosphate transport system ATPase subunit